LRHIGNPNGRMPINRFNNKFIWSFLLEGEISSGSIGEVYIQNAYGATFPSNTVLTICYCYTQSTIIDFADGNGQAKIIQNVTL